MLGSGSIAISALDEDEWSASHPFQSFRRKTFPVSIVKEAEWVPDQVWALCRREISLAPARNQTPIPHPFSLIYPDSTSLFIELKN
jgi:hypothetical protein